MRKWLKDNLCWQLFAFIGLIGMMLFAFGLAMYDYHPSNRDYKLYKMENGDIASCKYIRAVGLTSIKYNLRHCKGGKKFYALTNVSDIGFDPNQEVK